jgi:ferredoxin
VHLAEHPLVRRNRQRQAPPAAPERLDADWLKRVALDAGAADVGLVEIDRPELSDQRDDILAAFPAARTLVAFVCRVERENLRSPSRSVVDLELSSASREMDEVARRIVRVLAGRGIRAMNPPAHYPLETARWPEKMWVVAQKPVAVAAGLGRIGRHRLVVHPRFGAQVLLGTVLVDRPATSYDAPVAEDPCLECQLCVAACPVGAIGADGSFNALSCFVHSNRDRQGGFVDWVEKLASSRGFADYRKSFSDAETVSLWQNLTTGSGYKSSSCMAVCPTGEDVIGPYLADRRAFLDTVLRPLREKVEDVYVVPGGDAEASVARRFPHKRIRRVRPGLRARTVTGFLDALPILFQPGKARGLAATFHFTFSGDEQVQATVVVRDQRIDVKPGHVGAPDLHVMADSATWLSILEKERSVISALLRRRLRLRGPMRLMRSFAACFPV